tara:strand:- start:246 stop:443 length:198 start_codon:yes stop_codon:yes gene_type:complete
LFDGKELLGLLAGVGLGFLELVGLLFPDLMYCNFVRCSEVIVPFFLAARNLSSVLFEKTLFLGTT